MKKIFFLTVLLLSGMAISFAQVTGSDFQKQLTEAYLYNSGYLKPYHPQKAFQTFQEGAKRGIPEAMNALGIMYLNGSGVAKNEALAAQWFEKAAKAGYPASYYNLGMMYKYAYHTPQDLPKAYSLFEKAANLGLPNGKYATGYMLYKGLGCKQDYAKAFQLFSQASKQEHPASMYMLGLCYRNGYGAERDETISRKWLKKSDSLKFYLAASELVAKEPENKLKPVSTASARIEQVATPPTYQRVKHQVGKNALAGEYTGYIITFDWSGKHVIKTQPLSLTLAENGSSVTGSWREADTLTARIQAVLTESGLEFKNVQYRYGDHYSARPTRWNFQKASVEVVKKDNKVYLAGNLQLFSPDTQEPEKPIYISLVKNTNSKPTATPLANSEELVVFPNPFVNELNLSFPLAESGSVEVAVLTMVGNAVYKATFDQLEAGVVTQAIPMNVPVGVYLVKVATGKRTFTTVVVKQ